MLEFKQNNGGKNLKNAKDSIELIIIFYLSEINEFCNHHTMHYVLFTLLFKI